MSGPSVKVGKQTGAIKSFTGWAMNTKMQTQQTERWMWSRKIIYALSLMAMSFFVALPGQAEKGIGIKPITAEETDKVQGDGKALPLDQKNWKFPQASFQWVAMARDYTTPWDSVGRAGWMTDDAYVIPVDPGVSEFTPDTKIFYIVFAATALDAPSQYRAAWYYMPDGKTREMEPTGTDALELEMNEKSGYLEIFQPEGGWKKGKYLLRLFFESPGQELYDPNVVGTMEFTITDNPSSS